MRLAKLAWSFALVLGACSQGSPTASVKFTVDPTVKPSQLEVAALEGGGSPRPVAAVVGPAGVRTDFVARELVLIATDAAAAQRVADRFKGKLSRTADPAKAGGQGQSKLFLVTIDPAAVDTNELSRLFASAPEKQEGEFKVSSADGLATLAAGAIASNEGAKVSINLLLTGAEIATRSTAEAPVRDESDGASQSHTYEPDAFNWPYMKRGGEQSFGVAEAWRMLHVADRLKNKIDIAIFDGGFKKSPDFPADIKLLPADAWDRPNAYSCSGGGACPFHGTEVATVAVGLVDNGEGAAGTAGPVARPVLVHSPANDFWAIGDYIFNVLPTALSGSGTRVLNISAAGHMDGGLCLFPLFFCQALNDVGRMINDAGILVVAAAGNDAANLDERRCYGPWGWEPCGELAFTVPCEIDGVVCVGGVEWDSKNKAYIEDGKGSAYGSRVRLFGPFTTWVGPDPEKDINAKNTVLRSGTSFSSPFVAGIAALVLAAQPSLKPGEVASILYSTATSAGKQSGADINLVNAHAAVKRALGDREPPFVKIVKPVYQTGSVYFAYSPLACEAATEPEGATLTVRWFSDRDGEVGSGKTASITKLSPGDHQLTAKASDGLFEATSAPVKVRVISHDPVLTIVQPYSSMTACSATAPCTQPNETCASNGYLTACRATYYKNQPIPLVGTSSDDVQPGVWAPLPDTSVFWQTNYTTKSFGHLGTLPANTLPEGVHAISFAGKDDFGNYVSETVDVVIKPVPANSAPVPTVTTPKPTATPYLTTKVYDLGYADKTDAKGPYKELIVEGHATDPEDGPIPVTKLSWSLIRDTDPPIAAGTGSPMTFKFYPKGVQKSTFKVTLSATDSQGASGFTTIVFAAAIFQ